VLNIADVSDAVERLDDDEKGRGKIPTPGGDQEMLTINESGLYTLILRSNKPEAKSFRKWVTSEVLPSIRKTGAYAVPAETGTRGAVPAVAGTVESLIVRAVCALERRLFGKVREQTDLLDLISHQLSEIQSGHESMTDLLADTAGTIRDLTDEVRDMKLESARIPVERFAHPGGWTVRLFLIDNKPMIVAADYMSVCGFGTTGTNGLTGAGFRRNTEFAVRSIAEIANKYRVTPAHIKGMASLDGNSKLTFITPKGMNKVKERNPKFYEWYADAVAPHIHKLYEMAD